jgi:hypothetical protein
MKLMMLVPLFALSSVLSADVGGAWNLEMHWSGSDTKATGVCTLKQDETQLTGACESAKSVVSGEVKDRKLTIRIEVEQDGQKGAMTFDGTVDESGSLIRGTCKMVGGQDGTFTMRKQ